MRYAGVTARVNGPSQPVLSKHRRFPCTNLTGARMSHHWTRTYANAFVHTPHIRALSHTHTSHHKHTLSHHTDTHARTHTHTRCIDLCWDDSCKPIVGQNPARACQVAFEMGLGESKTHMKHGSGSIACTRTLTTVSSSPNRLEGCLISDCSPSFCK